jgi:endonuclease III
VRHSASNLRPSSLKLLQKRAKRASTLLHKEYGSPRHGNKKDPVDELIFIILSLMTTHHSFNRVYNNLKASVPNWDALLTIRLNVLRKLIKEGGLSDQKARRIIQIVKRIHKDFGKVTLSPLRKMADTEIESYLTALPGVGLKTAKCIMMYSLGRKVLPVDTHVWRVAVRLELIDRKATYPLVHQLLEEVVLPDDRYSFHVNSISHGRLTCLALRPKCSLCCLKRICPYPSKVQTAI